MDVVFRYISQYYIVLSGVIAESLSRCRVCFGLLQSFDRESNLRPTATATEWPTYLHNEFRRVVFHGTLHELLLMPGRSWSQADKTSAATAAYHGKQWVFLLNAARHRANTGYNARSLSVQMTPFA